MNFKSDTYNGGKDGFSLIELLAVLGITLILFTMILPKVSNSVEKAKKVKALDDVRQVILAVEDYNMSSVSTIDDDMQYGSICLKISNNALDKQSINTIKDTMTYKDMKDILNGKKDFQLNSGKIEVSKENT